MIPGAGAAAALVIFMGENSLSETSMGTFVHRKSLHDVMGKQSSPCEIRKRVRFEGETSFVRMIGARFYATSRKRIVLRVALSFFFWMDYSSRFPANTFIFRSFFLD